MIRKYKRHRIYYSSGIISLTLLPLMCIFYLNKYKVFEKEYALEINHYQKNWFAEKKYNYVKDYYKKPNHIINIDGNMTLYPQKMDSIKSVLDTIGKYEYATNSILIKFNDDAKYSSLLDVLDFINISGCKQYFLKGNSILIFNEPKYAYDNRLSDEEESKKREDEQSENLKKNGVCCIGCVVIPIENIAEIEREKKEAKAKWNKLIISFYPAWILLFIMIVLTFVRRKTKLENL